MRLSSLPFVATAICLHLTKVYAGSDRWQNCVEDYRLDMDEEHALDLVRKISDATSHLSMLRQFGKESYDPAQLEKNLNQIERIRDATLDLARDGYEPIPLTKEDYEVLQLIEKGEYDASQLPKDDYKIPQAVFDNKQECQEPINEVTMITPRTNAIASLPCIGCPIVKHGGERENWKYWLDFTTQTHWYVSPFSPLSLLLVNPIPQFYNISLSPGHATLLLNNIPIFPTFDFPHQGEFYVSQIASNFSHADLASVIACTRNPCPRDKQSWDGSKCYCLEPKLWPQALSFDYYAMESDEKDVWEISFDAIGGKGMGYLDDPHTVFGSSEQQRLVIQVKKDAHDQTLSILDVRLAPRQWVPDPVPEPSKLSFLTKLKRFFGLDSAKGNIPGHIVYWKYEWSYYGRKGTFQHMMMYIWDWVDWFLIFAIILPSVAGSVLLCGVLFMVYRLVMLERDRQRRGLSGMDREDTWEEVRTFLWSGKTKGEDRDGKADETQGLLDSGRSGVDSDEAGEA
ncbi:hypothetical protein K469DRAFT_162689 [Zopfia rhizophila CBS 207.26]|uniref:Uncharacterized protein n=1 Tax=Zopfia rhizophila CBS 207.26 TaxID=1314779 RepID=A0A6A6E4E6_9PEZI|nr:hypothetical protein K469DRAFT_162689 [Zopfia rhizophila CBS 207.26]